MAGHHLTWTLALCGMVVLLWQPAVADKAQCKMISACFFDCGHTVLDLTALKPSGKGPLFHDRMDSKGQNMFSYSPCSEFSEGSGCFNTSVCQVSDTFNRNKTINVGDTLSVTFTPATSGGKHSSNNNRNYLTYDHKTSDGVKRMTKVNLQCVSDAKTTRARLSVKGETPDGSGIYEMTLISQDACMQVKTSTTPAHSTSTSGHVTTEHTTSPHHKNVTTEHTTAHHKNATTEPHNVTTEYTTPYKNHTTEPHHVTTEHTTSPSKNVTTVPMTTGHSSVKTTVTTAGTSEQSTHGQMTTTPKPSEAYSFRSSWLTVTMMMTAATTVLTRL